MSFASLPVPMSRLFSPEHVAGYASFNTQLLSCHVLAADYISCVVWFGGATFAQVGAR